MESNLETNYGKLPRSQYMTGGTHEIQEPILLRHIELSAMVANIYQDGREYGRSVIIRIYFCVRIRSGSFLIITVKVIKVYPTAVIEYMMVSNKMFHRFR